MSETACRLREAGLISYRRGDVSIDDRAGLEALSCECYPLMKKEFARLVGGGGLAP